MLRYHLFMLATNLWARTAYRMRVVGKEHVPTTGRCIVVANHPGKLLADLAIFPALWPRRRPVLIAYGQMTGRGAPRTMAWGAKVFPMIVAQPRGSGNAVAATLEIVRALEREEAVFFMPEGEVSWTGRLNSARPAAAWAALRTNAPILPIGLIGTHDIWPRWQEKMSRTGKITVRIGKPFTLANARPQRITPEMLDQAGERIMDEIRKLWEMGH